MPETYTIESIGQKVLWENDQNKGDYPAVFAGHEPEVLLFHDSSSDYAAPKVGDEVFGDVEKVRGKLRLKRKGKPKGSGSSGGRGGGSTDKSIERQVAAKAAADMAVAVGGNAPTMVANFEAMFDSAIGKIQGAPQAAPTRGQEVPADTNGLEQKPASANDDVPF